GPWPGASMVLSTSKDIQQLTNQNTRLNERLKASVWTRDNFFQLSAYKDAYCFAPAQWIQNCHS
ncbi:hypothetical protein Ancab_021425, partial [Ancistrocladus abbreviatus]